MPKSWNLSAKKYILLITRFAPPLDLPLGVKLKNSDALRDLKKLSHLSLGEDVQKVIGDKEDVQKVIGDFPEFFRMSLVAQILPCGADVDVGDTVPNK